jgi:hypothetical protein
LVSPDWDWQECKQPVKRGVVMPYTDSWSGPGIDCPARLLWMPKFLSGNLGRRNDAENNGLFHRKYCGECLFAAI